MISYTNYFGRILPRKFGVVTALPCLAGILLLFSMAPATAQSFPGSTTSPITLTYNGDSAKVEQIIGDCDWTNQSYTDFLNNLGTCTQPTASFTITNGNILGTDIGYSFEDGDRAIFLFGDTIGVGVKYFAGDTFASTTSTDPGAGMVLNFFRNPDGTPLFVTPGPLPDGTTIATGADDVPNSGISLDGKIYIVYSTNSDTSLPDPHLNDFSVLLRFDPNTNTFTSLRKISALTNGTGGHFIVTSLRDAPPGSAPQPGVYIFGLGLYRHSDIYLSIVPEGNFETGKGTRYFAGLNMGGTPTWSGQESEAFPVVFDDPRGDQQPWPNDDPTIGNLSVVYSQDLGLWLMTFDGGRQEEPGKRETEGVYFTYSPTPWGPWKTPQLIYNAALDGGFGTFIHDPSLSPAGPAGPTIGGKDIHTTPGAVYAPLLIERLTTVSSNTLTISYTISTWNPYTVVRMRSSFTITHTPE